MRHLWSFLLSLLLTPLIYVSAGFAAVKFGEARELGLTAGLGLIGAFVAGALFAVLVMVRLSPIGPIFAGLLLLGVTAWALASPATFTDIVPADLFGEKNLLHVPIGFGTTLLAAPLLFTVFSPRRWRASAQPAPATFDAAPTYADATSAAPTYATPSYNDTTLTSIAAPTYDAVPAYQPPSGATTYEPPVYTPPSTTGYGSTSATPWPPPPQREGEERTGLM